MTKEQTNPRLDLNIADAMRLGGDLFRASRWADAAQLFHAVCQAEPNNHHACSALATCLVEGGKSEEALSWLDKAGTLLRDELLVVACNKGKALGELGQSVEALAMLNRIVMTDPENILFRYNRGLMLLQVGRHEDAIKDMDFVLSRRPDDGKARFARGFANLVLGNYVNGFDDYECRLKDDVEEPDVPQWDGSQDIAGKTVLVMGEQGLGDNIMFMRYIPLMQERGAKVLFCTPASIKPLAESALSGVIILNNDRALWPRFDYWVWSMSLAHAFRTEVGTVPPPAQIKFDAAHLEYWQKVIADNGRPRIGICWTGAKHSRYDQFRSIPLEFLEGLLRDRGAMFYSFQKDVRSEDKAIYDTLPFVKLGPMLRDFNETAHAMKCLDLMITVDTSVAHLAGTVGVPTWVLLTSFRTYWLWIQHLDTSPWYPSIRTYRQAKDGNWPAVIDQVHMDLQKLTGKQAA